MLLHIRIQLAKITSPSVWRELTVPAELSFDAFHRIIQAAFGWENAHLYFFSPSGYASSPQIKLPEPSDYEIEARVLSSKKTRLKDIFPATQIFTYTYDFGDDWYHKIKLKQISEGTAKHAVLTAGKGACPPEDCGGPWGYAGLKETLADSRHPEYSDTAEWMGLDEGDTWDPAAFDLEASASAVRAVT